MIRTARFKIYLGGGIVIFSELFVVGQSTQDRILRTIVENVHDIRRIELITEIE